MISDSKDGLIDSILSNADRLFRTMLPTVPEALMSMDVTMPQLKIMLLLYFTGPLRMSELAGELGVTLPTSTSLIDKLLEKGFVSRENHAEDRRVVICQLSTEGHTAISSIWRSFRINCQRLLSEIDINHLNTFSEIMKAMMNSDYVKTAGRSENI
jgi:DNA-binding MarR family transcriptional regulator